MSTKDSLLEMGFSDVQSQNATAACGDNLGACIDWIQNNLESSSSTPATGFSLGSPSESSTPAPVQQQARSLVCQDCGKQLRDEAAAEIHAARTQHSNFAESTEEVKPLTAEEKMAQLAKVKELLAEKRKAREENEAKEAKAKELLRRKQGQESQTSKEYYQQELAKKNARELKEKRIADAAAKKKVLQQIAKDKAERAAKANERKKIQAGEVSDTPQPTTTTTTAPKEENVVKKVYSTAKIQVRLTNGKAVTNTFQADDTFQVLLDHVKQNRSDGDGDFSLLSTFPRKVYTQDDFSKTLKELGLCPSSMLQLKAN